MPNFFTNTARRAEPNQEVVDSFAADIFKWANANTGFHPDDICHVGMLASYAAGFRKAADRIDALLRKAGFE